MRLVTAISALQRPRICQITATNGGIDGFVCLRLESCLLSEARAAVASAPTADAVSRENTSTYDALERARCTDNAHARTTRKRLHALRRMSLHRNLKGATVRATQLLDENMVSDETAENTAFSLRWLLGRLASRGLSLRLCAEQAINRDASSLGDVEKLSRRRQHVSVEPVGDRGLRNAEVIGELRLRFSGFRQPVSK
jgi:hypothetical protein